SSDACEVYDSIKALCRPPVLPEAAHNTALNELSHGHPPAAGTSLRSPCTEDCLDRVRPLKQEAIMTKMSRRQFVASAAVAGSLLSASRRLSAQPDDPFDFSKPLMGWETVEGEWTLENVPRAEHNGRALVQRSTGNEFNVILAPGGPYTNV